MKRLLGFILATVIFFTVAFCSTSFGKEKVQLTGPFDSLRDYIVALEARGRLLRIKEMDQDKYEATAFAYELIEKFGYDRAPAFLIERVKINGKWMEGPILGNIFCGWDSEAMAFGVKEITDDQREMYKSAKEKIISLADKYGQWKKIKPGVVDKHKAPCKEMILKGDDVNLLKFPWLKTNPGDAGQYINSGSVIMEGPELGRNVGTYRIQVKGKNKIGVNTSPGQHGWQFIMRARRRGERVVKAAIALGVDPIIWSLSTSKVASLGEDELEFAGGFRGKPVDVVKCETSDILVPAQAEIIIEGEIPMDNEEEGPFGELYGYMGKKVPRNFYMNVKAITHRKNPWIVNSFTGIVKLTHNMPQQASSYLKYKKMIPNLIDIYSPRETTGITILSINKRFPGDGMVAGQLIAAANFLAKVIIVVDKDIDIMDMTQVLHSIATRWQPHPASLIIPQIRSMTLDPSSPKRGLTSKIVIDATKQLSTEGGPESWPKVSRVILEEMAPESFNLVKEKWPEYFKKWEK